MDYNNSLTHPQYASHCYSRKTDSTTNEEKPGFKSATSRTVKGSIEPDTAEPEWVWELEGVKWSQRESFELVSETGWVRKG